MKKIKLTKKVKDSGLKLASVKPYKIIVSKKPLVDVEKLMASEKMRIANEVAANLIIKDEPEENDGFKED